MEHCDASTQNQSVFQPGRTHSVGGPFRNTLCCFAGQDVIELEIDGDRATMVGRSRVSAAVFGGRRSAWRLRRRFHSATGAGDMAIHRLPCIDLSIWGIRLLYMMNNASAGRAYPGCRRPSAIWPPNCRRVSRRSVRRYPYRTAPFCLRRSGPPHPAWPPYRGISRQ